MQVLLLLKSSDRVMHDICHAFDACPAPPSEPVRHALMLRKWISLNPERELRCFVRQHDLTGMCNLALRALAFPETVVCYLAEVSAAASSCAFCAAEQGRAEQPRSRGRGLCRR